MLVAFALFTLFELEGIRHFTRDLPGNAVTDVMVRGADRWHALMEDLGPARLEPAVRDGFDRVRQHPVVARPGGQAAASILRRDSRRLVAPKWPLAR